MLVQLPDIPPACTANLDKLHPFSLVEVEFPGGQGHVVSKHLARDGFTIFDLFSLFLLDILGK